MKDGGLSMGEAPVFYTFVALVEAPTNGSRAVCVIPLYQYPRTVVTRRRPEIEDRISF